MNNIGVGVGVLLFRFETLEGVSRFPTKHLGGNFIKVFTCSFYARRSRKPKKLLELTVFFVLLGSACVKAGCKMLVKSNPEGN